MAWRWRSIELGSVHGAPPYSNALIAMPAVNSITHQRNAGVAVPAAPPPSCRHVGAAGRPRVWPGMAVFVPVNSPCVFSASDKSTGTRSDKSSMKNLLKKRRINRVYRYSSILRA